MQTGYHFDGARYRNRKIIKYKKLNLGGEGKLNLESDDLRIPKLRVYVCVCMRMCVVCLKVTGGRGIVSCWFSSGENSRMERERGCRERERS